MEKLKDKVVAMSQEMRLVDRMIKEFEDRRDMIEDQKRLIQSPLHARANILLQWANRSLNEAISSSQSCSEQLTKPWQDQTEQLHKKKLALQAQHDHILQVLKNGRTADAEALVTQTSSYPMEHVDMKETEKELTNDIPTLRIEHSTTAVNQLQLRSFIGVLEPVQQTSDPVDTLLPNQATTVLEKTSGGVSGKGSDLRHKVHSASAAGSGMAKVGKKTPSDFFYCKTRYPTIRAMCPISRKRLWILYKRRDETLCLELFDAEGRVLTTVEEPGDCGGLCRVGEDVILIWRLHQSTVLLIKGDGSLSSHDLGIKTEHLISCPTGEFHYLKETHKDRFCRVKFALTGREQTDSDESVLLPNGTELSVTPPLTNSLTVSISEVVFDHTPANYPKAASAVGHYFAFVSSQEVEVYSSSESRTPILVYSYKLRLPSDACFCLVYGREMLLVAVPNDHEVHIVNHTDGGRFVCTLDPDPLDLYRPFYLATDYLQHVWVVDGMQKVTLLDLHDRRETNVHAEKNLSTTSPKSPSPPLRDVHAEDRKATLLDLQSQHTSCFLCHKCQNVSHHSCHDHTAASSTPKKEERCIKGIPPSKKKCSTYPGQRILRLCNQLRSNLSLRFRATQWEDDLIKDSSNSQTKVNVNGMSNLRTKVKDELEDRLAALTREIQQIDHLVNVFEDHCINFQRHKKITEQGFRTRADTLHRWVKQSVDDTINSIRSSSRQLTTPWLEQGEQLRSKKVALQAQHDHILQVLGEEKESGTESLVAQLSSNLMEHAKVNKMEKELTKDIPVLRVKHNTATVTQDQICSFVGILEPVQQTSDPEDTPLPTQPTSVQDTTSGGVSGNGSDLKHTTDSLGLVSLTIASSGEARVGKKPPREFIYSKFGHSQVHAMCPISHNRLWMMYKRFFKNPLRLELFDDRGQVLTTVEGRWYHCGLVAVTDDVILVWQLGDRTWQLVTTDGSVRSYNLGMAVDNVFSNSKNDVFCITEKDTVLSVRFSMDCVCEGGPVGCCSLLSRPRCQMSDIALSHSVMGVVFDETPLSRRAAASEDGRYFAFLSCEEVEVYARTESRSATFVCCYRPAGWPTDVRFCRTHGQEMLLVSDSNDHKVHVIDHTDGGRFVRYLDTGPLKLHRPCRLATDWDRHVWIACEGGNVVMVDL